MGRRPEQIFFQRRHKDGQQTHEKVLNITHHQGNASPNYNELSQHTVKIAIVKKTANNKCWRRCGQQGTLI